MYRLWLNSQVLTRTLADIVQYTPAASGFSRQILFLTFGLGRIVESLCAYKYEHDICIFLYVMCMCLCMYVCIVGVCMCVCMCVCLFICLLVCFLCVYVFVCLFMCLCACFLLGIFFERVWSFYWDYPFLKLTLPLLLISFQFIVCDKLLYFHTILLLYSSRKPIFQIYYSLFFSISMG